MAGQIRKLFFENVPLKVLSLLLACALFLLAREDRVKETEIDVPVVMGKVGALSVFTGDAPRSIRVRLQGRWSRLLRVLESRLEPYTVNLQGYEDGSVYPFDAARIETLLGVHGLRVLSVFPPSMVVRVEPRTSKLVPVVPDLVGEPDTGYLIEERQIQLLPAMVEISGASTDIAEVELVRTAPVDLRGLKETLETQIAVRRPTGGRVWVEPERIAITIPLTERMVSDELVAVPINVTNCSAGYTCSVEPTHVRVRVSGALLALRELKALGGERMVEVDARRGAIAGRHEDVPVEVKRFERLTMQAVPDRVTLEVRLVEPPTPDPADAGTHEDAGARDARSGEVTP
ncbi:MAG: hypothetical protein AMXMBFR64_06100 [Myxococcales bacterium]